MKNMKLFTPGPVQVNKNILKEASRPILFHRTKYFEDLYEACCIKLEKVFCASKDHSCLIITGSGTLACESVISSYFNKDDTVLVLSNGHFAERLISILRIYNINHIIYEEKWAHPFDLEKLHKKIQKTSFTALMLVAMETSTGMFNPVQKIGKLCKQNNLIYFVDAVSALGAEDINVIRDNIDMCISVANKGLESAPGLGLVCIAPRIGQSKRKNNRKRSLYLDMWKHIEYKKKNQTPFTPAVSVYFALNKSLEILLKEGLVNRRKRYTEMSKAVLNHAKKLNIRYLIAEFKNRANAVNSLVFSKDIDAAKLQKYLFKKGFTIWYRAYKEPHLQNMAQISVMGDITKKDIDNLFYQIERFKIKAKK